jgi:hypothetical protein
MIVIDIAITRPTVNRTVFRIVVFSGNICYWLDELQPVVWLPTLHAVMKPQSVGMTMDSVCLWTAAARAACDVGRLTATTVQVQYISKLTSLTSLVVLARFANFSTNQINNRNQFSKLTHMSDFFMKLISFSSAFIALLCSICFQFSLLLGRHFSFCSLFW